MFPYDAELAAAVHTAPQSIPDVIRVMQTIDAHCLPSDGLKWFNGLYLQVTETVAERVSAAGFRDPEWLAELDVQFARLYFAALNNHLSGRSCPGAWRALFSSRPLPLIARIQFALAGINAHINHDLPQAIVNTCIARKTQPAHGTPQYQDYTDVNPLLEALIETAKKTLLVRLLGDPLPPVSRLEDTLAAFGTVAAREHAWNHSQTLWHLRGVPRLSADFMAGLDGLTAFGNKALLVPVPVV